MYTLKNMENWADSAEEDSKMWLKALEKKLVSPQSVKIILSNYNHL